MRKNTLAGSFRALGYAVITVMAAALIYALWISLSNWSSIAV